MATSTVAPMKNSGMGAWMIKLLGLIPYVVSGIEQVHGDAMSGASKKQLALKSLGLAAGGAEALDPDADPAIRAATALAAQTIDGVKAVYNAAKGKAPAAPATPAAPAAAAPDAGPGASLEDDPTTGN